MSRRLDAEFYLRAGAVPGILVGDTIGHGLWWAAAIMAAAFLGGWWLVSRHVIAWNDEESDING